MICWKCSNQKDLPDKPGRLETCPKCNSFLHCCLNCKFYDKNAHHECKEPQAEFVKEKPGANYCGYFAIKKQNVRTREAPKKYISKEEAEKKWNELFKKK